MTTCCEEKGIDPTLHAKKKQPLLFCNFYSAPFSPFVFIFKSKKVNLELKELSISHSTLLYDRLCLLCKEELFGQSHLFCSFAVCSFSVPVRCCLYFQYNNLLLHCRNERELKRFHKARKISSAFHNEDRADQQLVPTTKTNTPK